MPKKRGKTKTPKSKRRIKKSLKPNTAKTEAVAQNSSAKTENVKYVRRPLPLSFTVIGLLLIIIFGFYLATGQIDPTWGMAFLILGLIMFIASLFSLEPNTK